MRYALIDYKDLKKQLNFNWIDELAVSCRIWIEGALKRASQTRNSEWTESIAVGSESFVTETKGRLGFKAKGRKATGKDGAFELREPVIPYNCILEHENAALRSQNGHPWDVFDTISV